MLQHADEEFETYDGNDGIEADKAAERAAVDKASLRVSMLVLQLYMSIYASATAVHEYAARAVHVDVVTGDSIHS